jgi:hypothetical protein
MCVYSHSRALTVVLVGLLLSMVGCAGTTFQQVTTSKTNGIRYYRPASYILITPDYEQGAAKVTIFHGPDTSTSFAADPYSWVASNKTLIEFKNGMLEQVSSEADGTKVASTTLEAAVSVTKEILDKLAKQAELAAAMSKAGAAAMIKPDDMREPTVFLFMATKEGLRQVYPPHTPAS